MHVECFGGRGIEWREDGGCGVREPDKEVGKKGERVWWGVAI